MGARTLATLVVSALPALACTARAPGPPPAPDCAAEDGYEFLSTGSESMSAASWYGFGDCTPGASTAWTNETIEGGGRCGSTEALVLRSQGYNDWGSGFGIWQWAGSPHDARGYEGISFWLRNPGRTEKGVLLAFADRQSHAAGNLCVPSSDAGVEADCSVRPSETDTDAGLPPKPNQCGNDFGRSLITSEHWQLYLLPFSTFSQQADPRRVDGPDLSAIYGFGFNIRKDSRVELWIDDISFYKRKSAEP
jgi:hypothetical protein